MPLLEKVGVSNLENLRRIKAISVRDVLEIYDPERYVIPDYTHRVMLPPGCMNLVPGAEWLELGIRPGNGTLSFSRESDGRTRCEVGASIAGDFPEFAATGRKLLGSRWLVVTEDLNGTCRLVGTPAHPLNGVVSYSSSGRIWTFTWTGEMPDPPYYLPDYRTSILTGDSAEFDFSFDFSFDS